MYYVPGESGDVAYDHANGIAFAALMRGGPIASAVAKPAFPPSLMAMAAARAFDAATFAALLSGAGGMQRSQIPRQIAPPERRRSHYTGVSWVTKSRKWTVRTNVKRKEKYIGRFKDEHDAAEAYDRFVVEEKLDRILNFPHADYAVGHSTTRMPQSSRFIGVTWLKARKKWKSTIKIKKKVRFEAATDAVHLVYARSRAHSPRTRAHTFPSPSENMRLLSSLSLPPSPSLTHRAIADALHWSL